MTSAGIPVAASGSFNPWLSTLGKRPNASPSVSIKAVVTTRISLNRIAIERQSPLAVQPGGDLLVFHGRKFSHNDSRRGRRTECALRTGASTRRQPSFSSSYSGVR